MNTIPFIPDIIGYEEERHGTCDGESISGSQAAQLIRDVARLTGADPVLTYTNNGGRAYVDGGLPECAIPEVTGPHDVTVYANAYNGLFSTALANLAVRKSNLYPGRVVQVVSQRRAIDDKGSTQGCHDSVSINHGEPTPEERGLVLAHGAARSCIIGAGLVDAKGRLHYSQKRSMPFKKLSGRMHGRTVYEFRDNGYIIENVRHCEYRLEYRDNDINILDWALRVRTGHAVGVAALFGTSLIGRLKPESLQEHYMPRGANPINRLLLQPDGTIAPSKELYTAIDFEQRLSELLLNEYHKHGPEFSPEYYELFREQLIYGDDFKKVLSGETTIESLFGRSDWATKFHIIRQDIERRPDDRYIGDQRSRDVDKLYDRFEVRAQDGELIPVVSRDSAGNRISSPYRYGIAEKLRQKGQMALQVSDAAVEAAKTSPPSDTRALERVCILQRIKRPPASSSVRVMSWMDILTDDKDYYLPQRRVT